MAFFVYCYVEKFHEFIEGNNLVHAPFLMMLGGMVLYFSGKNTYFRNKGKYSKDLTFWQDQKDEIWFAFVAGCMLIIWDTQILSALKVVLSYTYKSWVDSIPKKVHSEWFFILPVLLDLLHLFVDKITNKFIKDDKSK